MKRLVYRAYLLVVAAILLAIPFIITGYLLASESLTAGITMLISALFMVAIPIGSILWGIHKRIRGP